VQIFLEEEAVRAEEEEEWKTKRKKASHTKQKKNYSRTQDDENHDSPLK